MADELRIILGIVGMLLMLFGMPGMLMALDVLEERGVRIGVLTATAGMVIGLSITAGGVWLGGWATSGHHFWETY